MAFPYTTQAGFESGTLGHFDVETDTTSRLDFPHYTDLARIPGLAMPYRGANCMRVNLATSTTTAHVQETGSWDMTTGTDHIYVSMKIWLSPDIVMADTNELGLLEFWSSTSTAEAGLYLNYTTANGYRLGIGKASASSFLTVPLGQWVTAEVFFDPAGSAGGAINGWLNKTAFTAVTGLTNATITSGVVGVVGQDAGTTRGTILFDQIVGHLNGSRIGMGGERFPESLLMESSGHVFVGPGILDNVSAIAGSGGDTVVTVYDTDVADTTNTAPKFIARSLAANEAPIDGAGFPITITRGCYIALSGTAPRAMVQIRRASGYGSDGAIRNYAMRR